VGRRLFSKRGWAYWRCGCGHVFVDPLPSDRQNQEHYGHAYSEEQLAQSRAWFEVLARDRMRFVGSPLAGDSERTLVDAGCGYGFFLAEARRRGWSVRGIDFSGYPADFAIRELGLEIVNDDIETALSRFSDDSVDVLTFWHVLEHLDRPGRILDIAYDKLGPGGRLFLNSPNLDSAIYRLVGRHWSWIYTPGHVQYFSLNSVTNAVETRGFLVERAETWTHAPNLYFLVQDSLLHLACDVLGAIPASLPAKLERRLRRFLYSTFHHQVLQLRLFKVLYDATPFLDGYLRRAGKGHEFLLVAAKPGNSGAAGKYRKQSVEAGGNRGGNPRRHGTEARPVGHAEDPRDGHVRPRLPGVLPTDARILDPLLTHPPKLTKHSPRGAMCRTLHIAPKRESGDLTLRGERSGARPHIPSSDRSGDGEGNRPGVAGDLLALEYSTPGSLTRIVR
jgi:SAM-dependent methyltransferase